MILCVAVAISCGLVPPYFLSRFLNTFRLLAAVVLLLEEPNPPPPAPDLFAAASSFVVDDSASCCDRRASRSFFSAVTELGVGAGAGPTLLPGQLYS